jgi:hypothetical protein
MKGLAPLLFEVLNKDGWAELLSIEFIYFADLELAVDSKDDTIWRLAQSRGMVLLTDNRNDDDETSLTAVMRQENTLTSLPVVTVGNSKRLVNAEYRQMAANRLAEILFYLEDYFGAGRLFIP